MMDAFAKLLSRINPKTEGKKMGGIILHVGLIYLPLAISPGPNFLAVSRMALTGYRLQAMLTALGISTGSIIWATLAANGLGLIVTPQTIGAISLLGGLYLCRTGGKILWQLRRQNRLQSTNEVVQGVRPRVAYLTGVVTCLTNPQALVFFTSVFAGVFATDMSANVRWWCVLTVALISLPIYQCQATVLSHPQLQVRYLKVKTGVDLVCAGLFLWAGLRLLAKIVS